MMEKRNALALEMIKRGQCIFQNGIFTDSDGKQYPTVSLLHPFLVDQKPIGVALNDAERDEWVEYKPDTTIIQMPREIVKTLGNGVVYVEDGRLTAPVKGKYLVIDGKMVLIDKDGD